MLSFKPKKINLLQFSKNPACITEYSQNGKVVSLKFNFYVDPIVLIKNDIKDIEIVISEGVHTRPSVFDGVNAGENELIDNVKNRSRIVKQEQVDFKTNNILASGVTNINNSINPDLRNEISRFLSGNSTLENVMSLMPEVKYAIEKPVKKIGVNDTYFVPPPYNEINNYAVELLIKENIKSKKYIISRVNNLISEINEAGLSVSEIGNFTFPVSEYIKDYSDTTVTKFSNIIGAKQEDYNQVSLQQADISENNPIERLYLFFVSLMLASEFRNFVVTKDLTMKKIPMSINSRVRISDNSRTIKNQIDATFRVRNTSGGILESYTIPLDIPNLVGDFEKIRVSPYISATKNKNSAKIFIKQRDPNAFGVKVLRRNQDGSYANIGTSDIKFGETKEIIDSSYVENSENTNISYRVLAVRKDKKVSPVFNDTILVVNRFTNDTSPLIPIDSKAGSNQNYCKLTTGGISGETGKIDITGKVNIVTNKGSLYSVYRTLLSKNGKKIGEKELLNVEFLDQITDATPLNSFSFSDSVYPGTWKYEIEAINETMTKVIHTCEIIVSEYVQDNDTNQIISSDSFENSAEFKIETSYQYDNSLTVTSVVSLLNDVNANIDMNNVVVEFLGNVGGKNVLMSIKGQNSETVISESAINVITSISYDNLKSAIDKSTEKIQSNSSIGIIIDKLDINHIIPVEVE
jgi:hypothetical protein